MRILKSLRETLGIDQALTDDAIDILESDHRKVEALFRNFESAQQRRQKQQLLDAIVQELSIHSTVEEELVYPALDGSNHRKTAEAVEEHHIMKMSLAELAQIDADDPRVHAKVKVLSDIMRHHVKEEERVLFSQLKRAVLDLDELGLMIRKRKEQLLKRSRKPRTTTARPSAARKAAG